jgi:hypothetical protein
MIELLQVLIAKNNIRILHEEVLMFTKTREVGHLEIALLF